MLLFEVIRIQVYNLKQTPYGTSLIVRHPRCVCSNKDFSVLCLQSNTTIFHLVVQ